MADVKQQPTPVIHVKPTLLERIAELMPEAVYVYDLAERRVIYSNGRIADWLGFDRAEYQNFGWKEHADLIHPDDLSDVSKHIGNYRLLDDNQVAEIKYRLLKKDGSFISVLGRTKVFERTPDGSVARVVGLAADVTEQQKRQEHLERSQRVAGVGSWEVIFRDPNDLNNADLIWSDETYRLLGLVPQSAKASNQLYASRTHPEDLPKLFAAIEKTLSTGQDYYIVHRVLLPDGEERWIEGHAVVEKSSSGQLLRVLGTIQDVTERENADNAMRLMNRALEDRVEERTQQLASANEALQEKAEELARSNVELEQFAYVASHDLQEPLRAVANFSQLLERRYKNQLDAEGQSFIGFIVDGAYRMHTFINDLLTYSRLGRTKPSKQKVDLNQTLSVVRETLQPLLTETQGELLIDSLPTVDGNPADLQRVFQNLVANALKYRSKERAPRVQVSAQSNNGRPVIAVRDNGMGIEPEYHEKIFGMFQRLHAWHEIPGSGVGLAVCKNIVERHGGKIWVESSPGAGSTFFVQLS